MSWEYYVKNIRPYWLYVTKGYGLSVADIDMSCPADLEPYRDAHNLEIREVDNMAYAFCGNYVLSAVAVAVERNLAGKKSKAQYVDTPMLQEYGMSEEERKQKQIDLFVAKMEIMKMNFDANKR